MFQNYFKKNDEIINYLYGVIYGSFPPGIENGTEFLRYRWKLEIPVS